MPARAGSSMACCRCGSRWCSSTAGIASSRCASSSSRVSRPWTHTRPARAGGPSRTRPWADWPVTVTGNKVLAVDFAPYRGAQDIVGRIGELCQFTAAMPGSALAPGSQLRTLPDHGGPATAPRGAPPEATMLNVPCRNRPVRRLLLAAEDEVGDRPDEVDEGHGRPQLLGSPDLIPRSAPHVDERGGEQAKLRCRRRAEQSPLPARQV